MPSLQVRELPEAVYQKLKECAEREHRSIAQQAVVCLAKGLGVSLNSKKRRKIIFEQIKKDSDILSKYDLDNPADLIREDRDR
jgi:antitoxin FitA